MVPLCTGEETLVCHVCTGLQWLLWTSCFLDMHACSSTGMGKYLQPLTLHCAENDKLRTIINRRMMNYNAIVLANALELSRIPTINYVNKCM